LAITLSGTALPAANGGTGIVNVGNLTLPANVSITGGGTIALGAFTLTVPATGTVALLGSANTFTAANVFGGVSNPIVITQAAATSGSPTGFIFTGAAHTTLAASTEASDFDISNNRTVQFDTGTISTQRAAVFRAPTYSFVAASTISQAATLAITGAPVAGTNATLTNTYALWVQGGQTRLSGSTTAAGVLTATAGITSTATIIAANSASSTSVPLTVQQTAVAGATAPTLITVTGAAHTNATLSTEVTDLNVNLARTVQFATGALTTQRAFRIQAPTYAFVGASTITTAATLAISGAPVAGTNATLTNSYSLWVQGGTARFESDISVNSNIVSGAAIAAFSTTESTSVGTGALLSSGGLGVAKRAHIGTIGATFKGNVLAGVQDGTAAVSGQVGEAIESTISTPTNAAATGAYLALTSITLGPGAWDIAGWVQSNPNGSTLTVDGATELVVGTTTASSAGSTVGYDRMTENHAVIAGNTHQIVIPRKIINISTSTTYFVNVLATYTAGTPQWVGSISAVRIR
jgi:hypothetical protein